MSTNALVSVPDVPCNPQDARYVFTALAWLSFEINGRLVILVGSLRGDILVWYCGADSKVREELGRILAHWLQAFKTLYQIPPHTENKGIMGMDVYQDDVATGKRGYVAVTAADRSIRVLSFSAAGQWDTIFSKTLDKGFLPKAVCFQKSTRVLFVFSKNGGSVYAFSLYVEHLTNFSSIKLDRRTGEILSRQNHGPDIM